MELDEHINYFFDKDNRLKLNLTRKINKKYPNNDFALIYYPDFNVEFTL